MTILKIVIIYVDSIIQLCGIVDGLREEQAWSILDSVSWSSERAVELALVYASEETELYEPILLPARDREISHKVFVCMCSGGTMELSKRTIKDQTY